MNRVILHANSRDSLPDAFSDLQNYTEQDRAKLFNLVFKSYGVACATDETGSGILSGDTNLAVTHLGAGDIEVSPGYALISGLRWIYVAPTDTRTTTVSLGDNIYLQPAFVNTRLREKSKDFFLNTLGSGWMSTRQLESWEITTTDPGVSGVWLATLESGGTITDKRQTNLLRFRDALLDDTYVVRKDKENTLLKDLILNSGLTLVDPFNGFELSFTTLSGLSANVTYSGYQLYTAISGQHSHGTNHEYLANINLLGGARNAEIMAFLDSGLYQSTPLMTAANLRTEIASPLYQLFNGGIVNFEDGMGDRRLLTEYINYIPNVPSGVTFTLIQERAPENAPRLLRDAMRAYTFKEQQSVLNQSAYAGLSTFDSYIAAAASASGYTTSSGLQTDPGVMSEASGLISAGYVSSYADLYLDAANSGLSVATVMSQVETLMLQKNTDKETIDTDLEVLSKDVLAKGARMKVRPNATINKKYHARVSWAEPQLVDEEAIIGYDVRIFKYNADAPIPASGTTPTQLIGTYAADIIGETNVSTPRKRKALTEVADLSKKFYEFGGTGSPYQSRWTAGYRLAVSGINPISLGIKVGDILKHTADFVNITTYSYVIGFGYEDIDGDPTRRYYIDVASPIDIAGTEDTGNISRPYYDTSTANTFVQFPIDIDEAYIAYVRAVNENNICSDWTTATYAQTNDLPDNYGVVLISGIQEDAEYLEEIERIRQTQLTRKYETQIVNLQRQIDSKIGAVEFANLTQTVNENLS